jgi:hypothetical protein
VEFIATAPLSSVKRAQLVTLNILTGQNGDDDPNRPHFTIALVSGSESYGTAFPLPQSVKIRAFPP